MRIEGSKQAVQDLPITTSVLAALRETARLFSTHYSTMIEGNREHEASTVARRAWIATLQMTFDGVPADFVFLDFK